MLGASTYTVLGTIGYIVGLGVALALARHWQLSTAERLVGFMLPPAAFVLVVEMLVAYVMAHLPQGGWPIENQGELALLYAAIFTFLAAHGAGPASVDALLPVVRHEDRRHTPDRRLPHAA